MPFTPITHFLLLSPQPNMVFPYRRAQVVVLVSVLVMSNAMGDSSKDKEECTEQLAGLAMCLPYVGGQAKAPTPDCCSGLKQVLKNNKKCLCVIIKDRNDPDLGLQINVTLALSLPSVCNAPANVSKCPELLNMDPKSPEAQIFYQLDKSSSTSPASSPTVGGGSRSSQETSATPTQKSEGFYNGKGFCGLDILVGGLLVWALMGSNTLSLGL